METKKWTEKWKKTELMGGKGGQGVVVQVVAKNDPTVFGALKLMHKTQFKDIQRRKRFIKEIHLLNALNGNGVPAIIDWSEGDENASNKTVYFVSEWLDGVDLSKYLKFRKINVYEALMITRKLAITVEHCHNNWIFHRDIKPENIIIRNSDNDLFSLILEWDGLSIKIINTRQALAKKLEIVF